MKYLLTACATLMLALPVQAQRYLGDLCPNGQFKPTQEAIAAGDLRCADLFRKDLRNADLSDADLRYTNLHSAKLNGAKLKRADLKGADVRGVDFRGADLEEVELTGAYYDRHTQWPAGFDPDAAEVIFCTDVECADTP